MFFFFHRCLYLYPRVFLPLFFLFSPLSSCGEGSEPVAVGGAWLVAGVSPPQWSKGVLEKSTDIGL